MTEYEIEKLTPEIVAGWKRSLYDINRRFVKLAMIDDGKHIVRLTELGFDINHGGVNGTTPLFSLCNAPAPVVREMLANGAKVDICNRFGQVPLFRCVQNNNAENIKLLLEAGAEVNGRGHFEWTPLMEAVSSAAGAAAEVLLAAGADLEAKGKKGETALFMAVRRLAFGFSAKEKAEDVWKILELLLDKGADVDRRDCQGWTALMTSASINLDKERREEFIRILLDAGADVSAEDDDGKTVKTIMQKSPIFKDNVLLQRL